MNHLYYGDNLHVLRSLPAEHVDLIYLDPPFHANASYNRRFGVRAAAGVNDGAKDRPKDRAASTPSCPVT